MPRNKDTKPKKDKKGKKATGKKKYKVRNWREYNQNLVDRGKLDVYIDEFVLEHWYAKPNGKPGAQPVYSDLSIQLTLQFGIIFSQRLRQTEGLVTSILRLMNIDLDVPDYSTLSRRIENISIDIAKSNRDKVVLVADSSGLKIYGEGEWKVRKHGWSKHRTWRKMHLAITPDGEVRAAELTGNNKTDADITKNLIEQENSQIETFIGDGGYDRMKVYDTCLENDIKNIIVPPQTNAKIKYHGNLKSKPYPRDENLRSIRKSNRKKWKEQSGYHIRSLVETAMFRFKTIFGDKLYFRKFESQKKEFLLKISILNKITNIGMPDSYAVI